SFFHDIHDEKVLNLDALCKLLCRTNMNVYCDGFVERQSNPGFNRGTSSPIILHHNQIHIRILRRLTVGVRSEEDDLLRRELSCNLVSELENLPRGNHRYAS